MSPNPGRLLVFVFVVFCFSFGACAVVPVRWHSPSDFPAELGVTELDLIALPSDEEGLGRPITDFPNARLIGGDVMNLTSRNGRVTLQYSAYVIPDEQLTISNAQYSSIAHLFLSVNDGVPTEQGRYWVYDSGPITKPPAAPSNHQSAIRNELIRSRRLPDRSNFARTTIVAPDAELSSTTPLVESRAWCPLDYKQIPLYCATTKLALYSTVLRRGQVSLASAQLIFFFNEYKTQHGFDHPMLLKLTGEGWLQNAKTRKGLFSKTERLSNLELLTERQLELLAASEGHSRDLGATGISSEEFYRELRRLDEEASKPYQSWMVNHYLGGYTIGLLARYRPDAFTLSESTLRQWENDSGPYRTLTWLYWNGYTDGLRGVLKPPTVIGMDCESEKTRRAKRRCQKVKRDVLNAMADELKDGPISVMK